MNKDLQIITLAASSGKRNFTICRPSVCVFRLVFLTLILNVTHQGAARDAASVNFRPSITWTDGHACCDLNPARRGCCRSLTRTVRKSARTLKVK